MEHYDSEKAARVWQRVRSEAQPTQELAGLAGLITEENALAELYRHMAKQYPAAVQLSRECSRHSAMLRGICALIDMAQPAGKSTGSPPGNPLRVCYGKTLQAIGEYEQRSAHPEYGCAFRAMAEKKREHACRLLEIMGAGQMKG